MIIGKQNPVVGVEEYYQINDIFPNAILGGNNVQYLWYLWRKRKNGSWFDITKNGQPKEGTRVPYKFGETFLGTEFKIQVYKVIKDTLTQKVDLKRLFAELIIVPASSKTPSIEQVVLFNGGGSDVNKAHYTDTLIARAHCIAMFGQTVEFHLWEDDAAGGGHNAVANKNNKHSRTYQARVNEKGIAEAKIPLSADERILKAVANKYIMKGDKSEGKAHEYYVTASYHGKIQGSSQKNVNVANTTGNREQPRPPQQAPAQRPATPAPATPAAPAPAKPTKSQPRQNTPTFPATGTSAAPRRPDPQGKILDAYFVNTTNQKISQITVGDDIQIQIKTSNMVGKHIQYIIWEYDPAANDEIYTSGRIEVKSDIINTGVIKIDNIKFDKGYTTKTTVFGTPIDGDSVSQNYLIEVIPLDVSAESKKFGVESDGLMKVEQVKSPAVVRGVVVEGILDAYFAKKEYTKLTGEANGTHEYTFGGNKANNQTSTAAQKEKVATTILGKVQESLKKNKKYTTKEAIVQALTANEYGKDTAAHKKVTFQVFKLGAELKKVANAALESKLYLVASTSGLNGKQVTLIIKEKDGLLKGAAGAVLPILEITEAQMEQASTSGEVPGTEKSQFTATIENGIAKVPVHLRPKSNDDLKIWKDKLKKGKEDGEYTYKFGGANNITNENSKKTVAATILKNATAGNTANTKIADGKTAYVDDIIKALEIKNYQKDETVKFKLYKKEKELLYIQAKAKGVEQHDKEFLKADGAYFEIGKKCECEARIRAFMRTIRVAEGTGEYVKGTRTARDPQLGYTTWFSGAGNNFTLSDDHPRVINSNSTNTLRSSAAGAYQIMSWKYDELNGYTIEFKNGYFQKKKPEEYIKNNDKAEKYDAKGFSQISQDRLCIIILKDIGAITKLLSKDIKGAISTSNGTWVSLPGASAGQPTAKMQETLDYYEEFLKEELSGKSHLHVKSGFLKDFDIKCNCGNESSSDWHHPLDRMELRGWYKTGFYPGDSDHGSAEIRISKHHDGLDLYAPIGTNIYACVDGEVYEDYVSDTYGNTLGIKGTYKGETYYFFYAHLSERSVVKGATVTAGDVIGKTGQSGNARGQAAKMNHLHFEVRNTSEKTGGKLNPLTTIDELNTDVITNPDQNTQTGN